MAKPTEAQANKAQEMSDLVEIFNKPLEEYSDDELVEYITKIRHLRKVNITTKRKTKSPLDLLLAKLTPENARKVLESIQEKKKKEKEKEKESDAEGDTSE